MKVLQILPQRPPRDRERVQVQQVPDLPLDPRDPARKPHQLRHIPSARLNVGEIRHDVVGPLKPLRRQRDLPLVRDRGQVQQRVRGSADRRVDLDRVLERGIRQDLSGGDPSSREVHHPLSRMPGEPQNILHRGGTERTAGQRHAERLGHALHRAGRAHELTRAARRTSGELVLPHLRVRDLAALRAQRRLARLSGRAHPEGCAHAPPGHVDRGQIQPGGSHKMRGDRFVATRQQHHTVPWDDGAVQLDHIREHLARREDVIHPIVALGPAVAEIRRVEVHGTTAGLVHPDSDLPAQLVQMIAAGVALPVRVLDQDLRFFEILLSEVHAEAQRVELMPDLASPR